MQTFMDKQKNALLRKLHALFTRIGVTAEEKQVLLASYGVESSRDLTVYELTELCGKLDMAFNPKASDADRWRKRLIAAIDEYLRAMGKAGGNIAEIKAVACRAAQAEDFNRIGTDRLKSLYNAFSNRAKDLRTVDGMLAERLVLGKNIDKMYN